MMTQQIRLNNNKENQRLILGGRAKPVRVPPRKKTQEAGKRTYILEPQNIIIAMSSVQTTLLRGKCSQHSTNPVPIQCCFPSQLA